MSDDKRRSPPNMPDFSNSPGPSYTPMIPPPKPLLPDRGPYSSGLPPWHLDAEPDFTYREEPYTPPESAKLAPGACPPAYSPPPRVASFTVAELALATSTIRAVAPRDMMERVSALELARLADITWKLAEIAIKDLFFDGYLKCRGFSKPRDQRRYWAPRSTPPSIRYEMPPHLRFSVMT